MDFAASVNGIIGASTNEQRSKLEKQFAAAQKKNPAAFCTFAVQHACSAPPAVAQFVAIAFKNFILEQGRAATDKIVGASRDEMLGALEGLITGGQAPREILVPLCVGYGALLSLLYAHGACPQLFSQLSQWIETASDNGWSLTQPLLLLHQVLKSAAARPAHAATFEPVFRQSAELVLRLLPHTAAVRGASGDAHAAFVLASKIALRCGSSLSLNPSLIVACTELCSEYCGAASAAELSEVMQVELTRIGKVITAAVEKRCSSLSELGHDFASSTLMAFLTSSLALPMRPDIPEKFVARALGALQTLLSCADSDEFVSSCVGTFFGGEGAVDGFVRELVTRFLADDDVALDDWESDPERCVIAADADADADDAVHCAEQVFIAFLSAGKESVVAAAWTVLAELLMSSNESESIGALHAMGIGYDYLTEGQGDSFRGFLRSRLIPVARGDVEASLKLRRRAIWMIGMWCFLVEDPAERRTVFETFCDILNSTNDPVLCLTTWKSFENYISDDHFAPEQIDGLLNHLLVSIGAVTPKLRDPDMIKFVAQLLDVTMNKTNADMISFDSVIELLAPILDQLARKTVDEDDRSVAASASVIFETCAKAASQALNPVAAWAHLMETCLFTVNPDNTISVMADYEAWETIKSLSQCVTVNSLPTLMDQIHVVLQRCIEHCERDFEALPKCVHSMAILALALHEASQLTGDIAMAMAAPALKLLDGCADDDLATSIGCVLEIVVLAGGAEAAAHVFGSALNAAANNVGNSVMAFNASVAVASRCVSVAPEVWAAHAQGFTQYVDAIAEGYDEMTDPYQRRLIVNGTVRALHYAASAGGFVDEATAGLVHQTWESESLQEPYESKEESYANMWGSDGTANPHLARLHALAAQDTFWDLLTP